jgi:acyl carrier protein
MSSPQSPAEREMAELLISALNLEGVTAPDIQPTLPLFGNQGGDGLGLDSIDALEIALAVSERYGVQLRADDANNKKVFFSLRSLTEFVTQQRAAA